MGSGTALALGRSVSGGALGSTAAATRTHGRSKKQSIGSADPGNGLGATSHKPARIRKPPAQPSLQQSVSTPTSSLPSPSPPSGTPLPSPPHSGTKSSSSKAPRSQQKLPRGGQLPAASDQSLPLQQQQQQQQHEAAGTSIWSRREVQQLKEKLASPGGAGATSASLSVTPMQPLLGPGSAIRRTHSLPANVPPARLGRFFKGR